jgi:hypothetical protein
MQHQCWECGQVAMSGVCGRAHPRFSMASAVARGHVRGHRTVRAPETLDLVTFQCSYCGAGMAASRRDYEVRLRKSASGQLFCSVGCAHRPRRSPWGAGEVWDPEPVEVAS